MKMAVYEMPFSLLLNLNLIIKNDLINLCRKYKLFFFITYHSLYSSGFSYFNSFHTTLSIVMKQALPPIKLEIGSAKNTP
ncbi:MAG: hypothetical protein K0S61_1379 [Anaerocolumna sp.]|nr:hypothetical protein [Anaerocolumna sp.]